MIARLIGSSLTKRPLGLDSRKLIILATNDARFVQSVLFRPSSFQKILRNPEKSKKATQVYTVERFNSTSPSKNSIKSVDEPII